MSDSGAPPKVARGGPRVVDELAARLLAHPTETSASESERGEELDATTAASLETFMASLKAHLQLASPDTLHAPDASQELAFHQPLHAWTYEERCARVREAIRAFLHQEAHGVPPGQRRVLTTVRCLHAAVAQKSYGTEKRFLCPPPAVNVRGPLRHAHNAAPALYMHTDSEDGEQVSGEQVAALDATHQARFTELHVTGTGKAKSFRLQLHLLAGRAAAPPRRASGTAGAWARFESAPIGIISKPSKKSARARHASAYISTHAGVSLFNRINSQTYRTKYLAAQNGRLSAQSRAWTAWRLVLLARPPQAEALDVDPDVLTYGSTIVLVDETSRATSDPLVVCKVDRGRIFPPHTAPSYVLEDGTLADEAYLYGAVSQMQKVALLRCAPLAAPHGRWGEAGPRTYLCAATNATEGPHPALAEDALPLTYAASKPATHSGVPLDDAEDAFCWTLVSISRFEYSFVDVDALAAPEAPPGAGLVLTPFPIVTSLPLYDTATHKLAMNVQHFAASTDPAASHHEVWLGPHGPLPVHAAPAATDALEAEVVVALPPLRTLLEGPYASQRSFPLLFVRSADGSIYHSGRHVLCQDLVAIVRTAGDPRAAEALKKLHVGLGTAAGADDLPQGGVWTLRIV